MSAGRPTIYTEDLGLEICSRIASGESLRKIAALESMPDESTILRWALNPEHPFCEQYALARKVQAERMVDDLLDIADDGTNDWMLREGKNGESLGWVVNGEAIQRSRLRFQARQWLASKFLPKVYGDKQTVDMNTTGTQTVTVVFEAETPMTTIDAILASE